MKLKTFLREDVEPGQEQRTRVPNIEAMGDLLKSKFGLYFSDIDVNRRHNVPRILFDNNSRTTNAVIKELGSFCKARGYFLFTTPTRGSFCITKNKKYNTYVWALTDAELLNEADEEEISGRNIINDLVDWIVKFAENNNLGGELPISKYDERTNEKGRRVIMNRDTFNKYEEYGFVKYLNNLGFYVFVNDTKAVITKNKEYLSLTGAIKGGKLLGKEQL